MGALCTTAAVIVPKGDQIDPIPSTQDVSGNQDISGAPINQEDPISVQDISGSTIVSYDKLIQIAMTTVPTKVDTADITRNIEQYKEHVGIAEKK